MDGALETREPGLPRALPVKDDSAYARRITFFTLFGHALTHLYLTLFPPLLESMAGDFRLDVAGATFYYTIANVCFGLGAVPSGWLASRLGDKPLLAAFFVGSALGGVLIGAAGARWVLGAGAVCLDVQSSTSKLATRKWWSVVRTRWMPNRRMTAKLLQSVKLSF